MLNIELIQADTENVRNAIQRRGDTFSIDELVSLDNKRKLIQKELDNLRSDRKKSNQQIGLKKNPSKELIVEMKTLGQKVKKLEAEYKSTQQEIHTIMLTLPNIPRDNVPDGKDESSNQIVRTVQVSI